MAYRPETKFSSSLEDLIGELLVKRGKLRAGDLARTVHLKEEQDEDQDLVRLLVKLGMVGERDMAEALADLLGLDMAMASDFPDISVIDNEVSARFLKEHMAVPIAEDREKLVVAAAWPHDEFVKDALELACGRPVIMRVGVSSEVEAAIERLYGEGKTKMGQILEAVAPAEDVKEEDVEQLKDLASEAPVIRLVNLIFQRAVDAGASDIHIEPFDGHLKVRYRIDGVLHGVEAPPAHFTAAVISRIKLMAKLNIAERRLPQDGRIRLRMQGKDLDVRISTVPTLYGESVVMRLLNQSNVALDFETLGFSADVHGKFLDALHVPHGLILVTGPTGSGKTTTLYTALQELNTPDTKIITVEDPVEYQLEGINQIQVKPSIGLTFANALRSIVRQDPDVILVGEMRDLETARICVQSALTGHLVLSTLHTNDAASSVTRLLEMGVEDYLLTSTVTAVVAQRLVRVLCPECRRSYEVLPEVAERTGLRRVAHEDPVVLFAPVGCEHCNGTGYRGRMAIQELMVMTDAIRRLVLNRADASEIQKAARVAGMRTMYEDGLLKAASGKITLEEVIRTTQEA